MTIVELRSGSFAPGAGTAIVGERFAALLGADCPRSVVDRIAAEVTDPTDSLVEDLAERSFSSLGDIALVLWEGAECRVIVRGDVTAQLDGPGGVSAEVSGVGVRTWAEHVLSDVVSVLLTLGEPEELPTYLCLSGVVPACELFVEAPRWDAEVQGGAERWPEWDSPDDAALDRSPEAPSLAGPELAVDERESESGASADPVPHAGADPYDEPDNRTLIHIDEDLSAAGEDPAAGALAHQGAVAPQDGGPAEGELPGWSADAEQATAAEDGTAEAAAVGEAPSLPEPIADRAGVQPDEGGAYDHLFGATELRSVQGAAVPQDSPGPSRVPPPPAAAVAPAANGAGTPATQSSDHDGMTITVAELRKLTSDPEMIGAVPSQPAPAPSGTLAAQPDGPVQAGSGEPVSRCPEGHQNPPHAVACRACGLPVSSEVEMAPRVRLGRLRFSHGPEVDLDRPVLIGRSPRLVGPVQGDLPELVSVPSPGKDISRTHVEVRVEGWQVLVVDKGSTNGTLVLLPGRPPQRLRSGEPFPLPIGGRVSLAEEVEFTYEVGT